MDTHNELCLTHLSLCLSRFGTRRIKANQVYQEYIQERHHLHMNATKWVSLTEFVKYLGREGIVVVDENEKGWFIAWIDNSPEALKRQAALQKMERQKMDDEGRERKRLAEMIEKAKKEEGATVQGQQGSSSSSQQSQQVEEGLRRDQGPVKLGISLKPSTKPAGTAGTSQEASISSVTPSSAAQASSSSSAPSASTSTPFKMVANPLKSTSIKQPPSNPLRPPPVSNVFGGGSNPAKSGDSSNGSSSSAAQPRTMAERIKLEEEERRKRKMSGPMPSSDRSGGVKRIRM